MYWKEPPLYLFFLLFVGLCFWLNKKAFILRLRLDKWVVNEWVINLHRFVLNTLIKHWLITIFLANEWIPFSSCKTEVNAVVKQFQFDWLYFWLDFLCMDNSWVVYYFNGLLGIELNLVLFNVRPKPDWSSFYSYYFRYQHGLAIKSKWNRLATTNWKIVVTVE